MQDRSLPRLDQLTIHKELKERSATLRDSRMHLKYLLRAKDRLASFSARGGGLFLDYSRQRLETRTRDLLLSLDRELGLRQRFEQMRQGAKINLTEERAALHTASRSFEAGPIMVDGRDVAPEIDRVRREIELFCGKVLRCEITGATGRPFRHAVVVGIGGSYLGTEFVSTALAAYADKGIELHYLTNVDIHNFAAVARAIDPAETLWIIISKSYTTAETMANTGQVEELLRRHQLDPAAHMVTITAQGSPGDDPGRPVLQAFHMFDFIGGRYSVTSAVGGVPLGLYVGYERFEALLKGAAEMDRHASQAPAHENLPLLAALISVWNTTYLGYHQQAVIPYASPLAKLAPHFQQLNMESNGKAVDRQGQCLPEPSGTVIFGEPGTNAQHSFFQFAHQGRPFPIDFIGVVTPQYKGFAALSKGITNHQELWANMLAQAQALALGAKSQDKARHFDGNRPSSIIVLDDLTPKNVGRLLSFYEARTAYEGFIWGINSFDQFGVQLGKRVASNLRQKMAARNQDATDGQDDLDGVTKFYLDMLYDN